MLHVRVRQIVPATANVEGSAKSTETKVAINRTVEYGNRHATLTEAYSTLSSIQAAIPHEDNAFWSGAQIVRVLSPKYN